jgi:hypothetical protein
MRNQAGSAFAGGYPVTGHLPERQTSHFICIFLPYRDHSRALMFLARYRSS